MKFRINKRRQNKTISINSAISLILEEFGLKGSVIIEKIKLKWQDIVGELMAVHCIPDRIFKNILFISVDHPVYSNELSLMKNIIIQKINNEFGTKMIKDIRLEIKKLDWQKTKLKHLKNSN